MYYTKEEQIAFTDDAYISVIKDHIKGEPEKAAKRVRNYLSHYADINNVKRENLKERSFREYVDMILQ